MSAPYLFGTECFPTTSLASLAKPLKATEKFLVNPRKIRLILKDKCDNKVITLTVILILDALVNVA